VKLEWDERKRRSNLARHGIDFADLEPLFAGLTITINDERFEYPEPRFLTVGFLEERLLLVAHTETDRVIRIISARKATSHEKKIYLSQLRH
jgi:uncharacterized DUF497 family protein